MATVEFKMSTAGSGVSSSFKSKSRIQVTYTAGNGKITIKSIKGRRTDGNYGNYSNNSNNYLNLTINGVTKKVSCKLIDFRGSSWKAWTNFKDQTWTGLNGSYKLSVYISCTSSYVSGSTFSGNINAGYSSYTLTYDANGGSVSPTSATRASNATLGTLPTPSRTGYTFAGWFTAASGGTQVSSSTVMGAGNRTIYAHWNLNYYTLSFNANGGSVSPTSRSVGYGQAYGTLPTPSWTGRTFQGWFTAASGGSQVSSSTTMDAGSRTIYAHWSLNSYKQIIYVRYMNSSGSYGSYSAVINTNYNYGSTCSWSRAADSVYNAASISYTVTGANTKYVDVTRKQYTLTLNPNSGTYNDSTATYSTTNYAERTISLNIPEKDNWQYFGFVKTSGSGTYGDMYAYGDPASYNQIEIIVYDNNSSGQVSITRETRSADNPLPNTYQLKITTNGPGTTPGLGGFHRVINAVSGARFYHTFLAKVPVGYTLSAHYNPIGDGGTVTWVTNNKGTGNWEVYEYEVKCGTTGTLSTFGHVALNGGPTPVSWYLGTSNIRRVGISTIDYNFQTSNTNLIANYIPNYYCVQFDANGGEGSMDILNCYYGATRTLPNNQFTKDTYKFVGWNTKADGTGTSYSNQQQISNLTTTNRAFITLYAQWELDSLTISFNGLGGDNVPNEISYTYSESGTLTLPDNILTKSHYGFLGWDTDPSGTTVVYKRGAEYPKSIQENVTLYAVWAPQIQVYLKDQDTFKLGYLWTMKDNKWKIGIESFGKDNNSWQAHISEIPTVKLTNGLDFNYSLIALYDSTDSIKKFVFSQDEVPTDATTVDVSEAQDESVIAYTLGDGTITVTSKILGSKIVFNEDSSYMFSNLPNVESIDFGKNVIDTSNVTNMNEMFVSLGQNANSFILDLNEFDTSNVITMVGAFGSAGYRATTWSVDLSKWNTSNVEWAEHMFSNAGKNANTWYLDLSGWDASKLVYMSSMFSVAGYEATTWTLKTPINLLSRAHKDYILEGLTVYDANNNYELMDENGSNFPSGNSVSHTLVNKIQ